MSDFERPQPSYRLTQTQWEDDLQAVAAREMGEQVGGHAAGRSR